ncbi:MAG: hypothetical protein VR67_15595 [Peptococcaceae bacterium BRH_c8a]|nr:MAG: hypothetical protein VR67_15595 [Peptococcaceae bacterium BRH_c8a]
MNADKIQSVNLLKQKIKEGISLFLGSGFSVLASNSEGKKLPVGSALLKELKIKFPKINKFPDLAKASTVLEANAKQEFYNFLVNRFTVKEYHNSYEILNEMKLKNIYTTNIDNLTHEIFSKSLKYYINDTSIKGQVVGDKRTINYYPLHGCVLNPEKGFIFSNTKIASAYSDQKDDWQGLRRTIFKDAILFWGWSFSDSDVIEAIYSSSRGATDDNVLKWIVLYDAEDYEIDFYRALNFNIIRANTSEMLDFIKDVIAESGTSQVNTKQLDIPREYLVPQIGSVPLYPLRNFYEGDTPRWSYIFSGDIVKTHYYNIISDLIATNRNIFIIGVPAAGKSTLMMQLASEYKTSKHKHILNAPTKENAQYYANIIGSEPCLIFIDECLSDFLSMKILLEKSNIQVVGFDRDYRYEGVSHKLRSFCKDYELCDISAINDLDIQKLVDKIPSGLRKTSAFGVKIKDNTIFEVLRKNVQIPRLEDRFSKVVPQLYESNPVATELFVMICYVHSCGVPVSYDMVYSYLRDVTTDYKKVYKIIGQIGSIIKEYYGDSSYFLTGINFDEQDYYKCRSNYLAELIIRNIPVYTGIVKNVLNKFIENVPPFKISRFDIFKKRAFDADITTRVFNNYKEGLDFYKGCLIIDESEFLYQQAAIYFNRKKKYSLAFEWIDKAKNNSPFNSFSIRNTHAIILFNANFEIEDKDGSVLQLLCESLNILKECYNNDKRKGFHAKIFADLSLKLYSVYPEVAYEYIELAYNWLSNEKGNPDNGYTIRKEINELYNKVSIIINYHN